VVGNIGAAEVVNLDVSTAGKLVELIRADAFTVHLNPLQEFLQPEGNPSFRGVLQGIERLVRGLPVPVIVKEIGAGISTAVAGRLLDVGVRYIDAAGAGGTSWAGVEILRGRITGGRTAFWDWGIPLAHNLIELSPLKKRGREFTLIASGGVTSGLDAAKCIALGADIVAAARVFLLSLQRKGKSGLVKLVRDWESELRGAMFLTGSGTIKALQQVSLVRYDSV
jgi:isopentenyl-diphosphate delta-isomerase